MANQFNSASVQSNGGVAWAKQQIDVIKDSPGAIDDQISGYQNVNDSLNQIIDTLNTANASLQSAWSGTAAETAGQTFTDTANHAQNVTSLVDNTITQLQAAKKTAQSAVAAMSRVPNEKPVPQGNIISNGWDELTTGTTPGQQAEQDNATARTQAADVLNELSSGYNDAATNMTSLSSTQDSGFTPSPGNSNDAINLDAGDYGGGSGAAADYAGSTGAATGGSNDYRGSNTGLAGAGTTSKTGPAAGITSESDQDPGDSVTTGDPFVPGSGVIEPDSPAQADDVPPGTGADADGDLLGGGGSGLDPEESGSPFGGSGVFGEDGLGGGGGSIGPGSASSTLGEGIPGESTSSGISGVTGGSSGTPESVMQQGPGGARGGTGGFGDEELGPVKYSRGRFIGGDEPGSGLDEWVMPSVGGDETLLIRRNAQAGETAKVASAYDEATDADGNRLGRMGFVGRQGIGENDAEERGERPGHPKEDPESWKSKRAATPPAVR